MRIGIAAQTCPGEYQAVVAAMLLRRCRWNAVTAELRAWFDADPSQTGRALLERLQGEHPDRYPDRLLRTLQRRLKVWRGEMAKALVFGIRGRSEPRADAVDGRCASMIVRNIGVRQRATGWGAFLHEAVRNPIQIVALQPSPWLP